MLYKALDLRLNQMAVNGFYESGDTLFGSIEQSIEQQINEQILPLKKKTGEPNKELW